MQVYTGPDCYIFDLTLPEVKTVVRRRIGLRQMLERLDVEKVMHDSHLAITAVYEQLKIRLGGVFDTMVCFAKFAELI